MVRLRGTILDIFVKNAILGDRVRVRYDTSIHFRGIDINEVIIDQHYNQKHFDISDWIILELIKELHDEHPFIESEVEAFTYFVAEPIYHNNKPYRLIFLIEKGAQYIGVINAFRVREKKHGISIK